MVMHRGVWKVILAALVLTTALGVRTRADGVLQPQLAEIMKVQEGAHRRLAQALEGRITEAAERRAYDRYQAETDANMDRVRELVRANPKDPGVIGALQFVIKTAGRGPGDQAYRAVEFLPCGHVRDAGLG